MPDTPDARRGPAGVDDDLLSRYLAGQCTAAERAHVREWLTGDPSRDATLEAFTRALAESNPQPGTSRVRAEPPLDAGWARVMAKIAAVDGGAWPAGAEAEDPSDDADRLRPAAVAPLRPSAHGHLWPRGVGGSARRSWPATMAALVLVILGSGVAIGIRRHGSGAAAAGREYATAAGQRLSVTLVDGTRLTLAPASRVRVAAGYGHETDGRDVELEGEAYFAVVHNAAHPFAVRAHGAVARDVGTAFDVRAYPEDPGARVAVAEGEVAVAKEESVERGKESKTTKSTVSLLSTLSPLLSRAAQLHAGDVATVGDSGVAVTHRGDVRAYVAWMQGGLVFENSPIANVARELERTFDLAITIVDSSLIGQTVTARFESGSADDILDAVTQVIGARYERAGHRVVIRRASGTAGRRGWESNLPPLHTAQANTLQE